MSTTLEDSGRSASTSDTVPLLAIALASYGTIRILMELIAPMFLNGLTDVGIWKAEIAMFGPMCFLCAQAATQLRERSTASVVRLAIIRCTISSLFGSLLAMQFSK
jgi:hypothetical protein